jgi:hypothetical protein
MSDGLHQICQNTRGLADADRDAILAGWETDYENHAAAEYPSWFRQGMNLGQALIRAARKGFPVTTESERAARRALCDACPERTADDRCRACGCFLTAKLRMASERCPLGKWEPADVRPDTPHEPYPDEDDDRLDADDLGGATRIPAKPTLCDADGLSVNLKDFYKGRTAYLLGGGPSLAHMDLSPFSRPGVLTLALNNVISLFRPTLWLHVDDPNTFPGAHWNDPHILKFSPRAYTDHSLTQGGRPRDCPAMLYFRRNARFRADRFLVEPSFNWGCDQDIDDGLGHTGARSVFFVALKLLWLLGVTRVYLLGVDWHFDPTRPYAHDQLKDAHACASNNDKFRICDLRLRALRPILEAAGLAVLNATPGSCLEAFEKVPLSEPD